MEGLEGTKGKRSGKQSDKAKNHHQRRLYGGCFEVHKVILFSTSVLCLSLELCFLPERGADFQKKMKTNGRKVKN